MFLIDSLSGCHWGGSRQCEIDYTESASPSQCDIARNGAYEIVSLVGAPSVYFWWLAVVKLIEMYDLYRCLF